MMENLLSAIRNAGFIVELIFCCAVFMKPLQKRPHALRCFIWGSAGCILFCVVIVYNLTATGSMFRFLMQYCSIIPLIYFCCRISLIDAVFCSIFAYIVQHFGSSLLFILAALVRQNTIATTWYHPITLIVQIAVCFLAYFLVAKYLCRDRHFHMKLGRTSITVLLTLSFTIILSTFTKSVYSYETGYPALYILCHLYDILCCAFMLLIQVFQQKESEAQKELALREQLWYQQKDQYEVTAETIDIINRKCHDLKHQLSALEQLEPGESWKKYIQELSGAVHIYDLTIKTGNHVLDTVLTQKNLICEQHQITMTCIADGAHLDRIDSVDVYTIFGNSLDNAIEYVCTLDEPEKRIISVSVFEQANLLLIQFENYFEGTLTFHDELPCSTKENNGYHGFGLKSIQYTVRKYGGYMSLHTDNNLFQVHLAIPIAA